VNRFFSDVNADVLGMNVAPVPTPWMLVSGGSVGAGVWPFPFGDPTGYRMTDSELVRRTTEAGTRVVEESGLETDDTLLEVGDPVTAISEAAEHHDADLVVVGASDKGWWSRLLEGSVTAGVLQHSRRPVLVVP
jgi:nucleotide-binding universal stress UspA family protein